MHLLDRSFGAVVWGLTRSAEPLQRWLGYELAPRPLSDEERAIATRGLGQALDAEPVRLVRALSLDTWVPREGHVARAIGNHLFIPGLEGPIDPGTLVHELCHVVQFQRGGLAYIGDSVRAQLGSLRSGRGRHAAYDWRGALAEGATWATLGAEQQAQLVEDAFRGHPGSPARDAALAEALAGRGWCGQ